MLACIGGCSGVIGFKVGTRLCPVRERVRLARPDVGVSARKFARRAEHTPISVFCACWASCVADRPLEAPCWASFSRLPAPQPRIAGDAVPYMQEMVGVLHYMKPSGCVSPACRSLM